MKPAASLFADVPLVTPAEKPDSMPAYAVAMLDAWRAAFATCGRYATIGGVTGLGEQRAARILGGLAMPTRAEAAAFDSALGVDTAGLFPKRSASVVQSEPPEPPPQGARPRRKHAMAASRLARMSVWEARFERYGRNFAELSREAGVPQSRVWRILCAGAYPSVAEQLAFERVLGVEP